MRLALASIILGAAALLLAGCGGSEEDKMERGLVVDREVAVPESDEELDMTEAERQAANDAEEEAKEAKLFEESQQ